MRRRSTTTGLMADASRLLQDTVDVLSIPERGVAMFASGHTSRRVALWGGGTREASSRSDLVSFPPGFLSDINSTMMLGGKG